MQHETIDDAAAVRLLARMVRDHGVDNVRLLAMLRARRAQCSDEPPGCLLTLLVNLERQGADVRPDVLAAVLERVARGL